MTTWMNASDEIAPSRARAAHGRLFGLTAAKMRELGYEEREDTPPAAPVEEVVPRTVFTKLEIRRTLRKLGLEDRLDEILDTNAQLKKDWEDAQEIDINDESLQEAVQNGFISRELFDEVVEALRG